MKWYSWMLVVFLIVFSNVATLWVTKHYLMTVRVVDTVALIDRQKAELVKLANQGRMTFEEAVARQNRFLENLERDLQGEPLVFVKQCVVGKHEDITKRFDQKIKISGLFLLVLIVFSILPFAYEWLPYKIVATKDRSFPYRVWIEMPPRSDYQPGEYIELKVFFKNQYVENVRFLVKQVACRGGDDLSVREGIFYCNGVEIARAQFIDSAGRPLQTMSFNGKIPEKSYFVLASHPMSYDSRYYGLVEEKFIVHRMRPIL